MTKVDDHLCGCDVDTDVDACDDDQIVAVVLFADVDWTDPDAVSYRMAEWEALSHA
jgi:hypothetical protein